MKNNEVYNQVIGLIDLPDDVLFHVFSFYEPIVCLHGLRRVCKRFNDLIQYFYKISAVSIDDNTSKYIPKTERKTLKQILSKYPKLFSFQTFWIDEIGDLNGIELPFLVKLDIAPKHSTSIENLIKISSNIKHLGIRVCNELIDWRYLPKSVISLHYSRTYECFKQIISIIGNDLKILNVAIRSPSITNNMLIELILPYIHQFTYLNIISNTMHFRIDLLKQLPKIEITNVPLNIIEILIRTFGDKIRWIEINHIEETIDISIMQIFIKNMLPYLKSLNILSLADKLYWQYFKAFYEDNNSLNTIYELHLLYTHPQELLDINEIISKLNNLKIIKFKSKSREHYSLSRYFFIEFISVLFNCENKLDKVIFTQLKVYSYIVNELSELYNTIRFSNTINDNSEYEFILELL